MFLSGRMSEKSVREYLAVLCFNTHTVTTLVEGCRLYQLSLDIEVGCTDITADDRSIVSEAKDKSPNGSIEKPSPPPMLYICDLDCSIEAIMHLGMNVTKHCCQAAFNWSKDIPGFSCTELIQGAQQFIKSIDSLKVSDFAVMGFKTEEMGGYVAETYRAYLQLAPWTFRWINQYEDSRNQNWIQQLDVQKLNSWTKLNMLSFLSVRGINIKRQMFKNELIDKVMENKNLPELQTFKAFSGADMREMMLVLNCFVSALFATDITGKQAKNRLSALARMYLTFSSRLDMFLMKTTPSWITTFSLLGMLRSADTFSLAPYPICFYEGDGMGEGIIKEIRPIILTGLRKGWTLSGQGTYYRMQTLTYMQDVLLSKSSLDLIAPKKRPVRAMTKVYKYFCSVDDALDNLKPFAFSLFRMIFPDERVIGIVICFNKQHYIRILHVANDATFQDPYGLAYFNTETFPKHKHIVIDAENLSTLALTYETSGIALPSLQPHVFAYILGNGEKKFPGETILFSPSTINKRYTATEEYE